MFELICIILFHDIEITRNELVSFFVDTKDSYLIKNAMAAHGLTMHVKSKAVLKLDKVSKKKKPNINIIVFDTHATYQLPKITTKYEELLAGISAKLLQKWYISCTLITQIIYNT